MDNIKTFLIKQWIVDENEICSCEFVEFFSYVNSYPLEMEYLCFLFYLRNINCNKIIDYSLEGVAITNLENAKEICLNYKNNDFLNFNKMIIAYKNNIENLYNKFNYFKKK